MNKQNLQVPCSDLFLWEKSQPVCATQHLALSNPKFHNWVIFFCLITVMFVRAGFAFKYNEV